jgi:Protein of unknown function (DUF3108)
VAFDVPCAVLRSATGVWLMATLAATASPVLAQGRLDARYSVTLSGMPVGKGSWVVDIAENQFTAAASGATAGLLRVFASGQGSGASRGYLVSGNPVPATFAASITSDKKTEEIRMTLAAGDVKEVAVSPEWPDDPERVPVTEAHFHGVSDPMTGSLIRVPGTGNPLGPQACQRTTPIFDGRMRYNLQFVYKRMEQVKADKGYEGPVVVCAMYFVPIAGYIPHRPTVKYLASQRDMEVWLAPVAATRVLVPYRISIPTPVGLGVMEATQFITVAQPRAASAGTKTQ